MATLVGMNDSEAHAVANRVFHLFRRDETHDPHSNILADVDRDILALMGFNLNDVKEVTCMIRPRISRNNSNAFMWGSEGKVFGIDIKLRMLSGESEVFNEVFLLKVFSDNVIDSHATGLQRLQRTQYLCSPARNLQLLAKLTNDELRFAGAPILGFRHHLEHPEKKKKGEEFVCYVMKNAAVGMSPKDPSLDDKTIIRTWGTLRNDRPLSPRDRITLACDLARAAGLLAREGIQHCDLSPENVLAICPTRSGAAPRLALIDFDSFYTAKPVPTLPVHKQQLFSVPRLSSIARGGRPSDELEKAFEREDHALTEHAEIGPLGSKSYRLSDPGYPNRARHYLLEPNTSTGGWDIWLLGAPGHEGYRAPIDILASEAHVKHYDNFALGLMIFEILCWLDINVSLPIVNQKANINPLARASSEIPGKLHFILHRRIRSLLERVFCGDPVKWPTPSEWVTALQTGPIYRICPGPMRSLKLWSRQDRVCMWPWFHIHRPDRKIWRSGKPPSAYLTPLLRMHSTEREALLEKGLSDTARYCPACGSPVRWL